MEKFMNSVMSFINENTTLLIIICVFLIFVLIGYLIDNSIKARKLAKIKNNGGEIAGDPYVEELANKVAAEPVVEEDKAIEPEVAPVEDTKVDLANTETSEISVEDITPDVNISEESAKEVETPELYNTVDIPEVAPLNDIKTTNFDEIELNKSIEEEKTFDNVVPIEPEPEVEVQLEPTEEENEVTVSTVNVSEPEKAEANEFSVDPAINDLLNKDFSNEIDVNEMTDTNKEPVVKVEEIKAPVKEESKYKNSKSLAEILGSKKNTTKDESDLMNTVEFQQELDKILKRISEDTDKEIINDVKENPELMNTVDFQNELDRILKKMSEEDEVESDSKENPELMNTVDFQNELDRILKKINENSIDTESKDSTLDETTDFTNMF